MKTAMQLLFEKIDRMPEYLIATYLKVNRNGLLEKEKEQIQEAHKSGGYEMFTRTSKQYYNQTYKPETI